MDFFPLLPNTTGHLLCFLKFRIFIHVWIPRFPRRRKIRWHLYRSTREVKCGDLVREGPPKNLSETETCRFSPHSGVCDWYQPQTSDYESESSRQLHSCLQKDLISDVNLVPNVFIKTSYPSITYPFEHSECKLKKSGLVGKQGNDDYGITGCVSIWNGVIVLAIFWDQSPKGQSTYSLYSHRNRSESSLYKSHLL